MSNSLKLPSSSGRVVVFHLYRRLKGRRLALLGVLFLLLLEAATAVMIPMVIGEIVDEVLQKPDGIPASFMWKVALLVAAALGAGLFTWLGGIGLARVAEGLIAELREDYVNAALNLPRSAMEAAGSGDVVTRASDDIAQISDTLPEVLPKFIISTFTVILIVVSMSTLNWKFLLAFLVTVPLYWLSVRWYLHTAPVVYQNQRAIESVRGQHILGTLENLDTIATHQLGARQQNIIDGSSWEKVRWAMRTRIVQNRLFGRLNFTQATGLISVLLLGTWLAAQGEVTPGEITAATLLFQRIIGPVQALMFVMDDFQSALSSLSRLIGVISYREVRSMPTALVETANLVDLEDVSFSYLGGVPVLANINLTIAPGEKVAVVGATGSGKSTLANLIAGAYQPNEGQLKRGVSESQISVLSQECHVFIGTVRSNLSLAAPDSSDDQLWQALNDVGANHLVQALPDGLDTQVGFGAQHLEPEHVQHLALARLVLQNADLVILDEATAEADSSDANFLDHASAVAVGDRAALIIAHRLSQITSADKIIVMEAGTIVESGSLESLLTMQGRFAQLWQAWSADRSPVQNHK